MQALREIITTDSTSLLVELPEEFVKHELEVIVLPLNETSRRKKASFNSFLKDPINITDFQMPSREERNAR